VSLSQVSVDTCVHTAGPGTGSKPRSHLSRGTETQSICCAWARASS
jgi:hypothetical protein